MSQKAVEQPIHLSAREMAMKRRDEALKSMASDSIDAIAQYREKSPWLFLEAWKQGVNIVGEKYFSAHPSLTEAVTSQESITDKQQLIPNLKLIEADIAQLSGSEAALLAVMCSFYNSRQGGKLMRGLGIEGMAEVSQQMSLAGNQVVARLLVHFTEW